MSQLWNPANYAFSWYSVPLILVGFIIGGIGIFVLKQNFNSKVNRTFCLLCSGLFVWLTGYAFMYSVASAEWALVTYRRYTFLGVVLIPINVYLFSVLWLDLWRPQKHFVLFGYAFVFTCYALANTTDWVVPFVDRYFWGYYSRYAAVGVAFFIFFVIYFFTALFNFVYRLKHPIETIHKSQIYPVIIAFCFAVTGSFDFVPKIWHIEIYPFGYISAFFWIMGMAYAIVKYRVMDIQTVIHKTLLWLVTTLVFVAPVGVGAYLLRDWLYGFPKWFFALCAFLFTVTFIPYVRFVQPYIDQWFERRKWNLNLVLKQFSSELVQLKSLEELAQHILGTIQKTLYPKESSLLLWDEGKDGAIVFEPNGKAIELNVSVHRKFFDFLIRYEEVVLADFVGIDPRLSEVKNEAEAYFEALNSRVCVPVVLDQKLIGVINLSGKTNLKNYTGPEILFLADLRASAAVAISNSLRLIAMQAQLRKWNEELERLVQERTRELKDAQAQLIQAEKLATIGTLAGGVAHEINNPLAAILTNAQMLLGENVSGDAKESLELIEEAADRCRVIVQKLMKYSRKSKDEPDVESVDLKEVLDGVLAFLKYQLEQENVDVHTDFKTKARVRGIANEYSQVFTNLIVNAKDALQAKDGKRSVAIRAYEKDGQVIVDVEDKGSGIKPEILSKIFDPFFTTKDVGKGTGLGLSIVQGIMQKFGGQVDAKSKVGSGTTITLIFLKS